ncbi:PilW family protein [Heliorestis convoluta]|uniref:Prepilin-type N-terminal cleavage/methylation domain protein, putative n=1 Tax=Heliorestis convoluta TaxID=356322 RepID=A0A5Q2MZF4_9FIRM|nr:prepilin-type N-terminal cleavage/methylation domain-containing protein [Heliorestis convoluta]QGG46576.1 prepilin-type N-terminal cleavage/methylation domain protein, putative [Heliorestis convoluta]
MKAAFRSTKKNYIRNNKGVTLVELLVGIALLSLVMTLGYSFYFFGYNSFATGEVRSDVRQNIRFAADFITQELTYATHVQVLSFIPDEDFLEDDYHYIYVKEGQLTHREAFGEELAPFGNIADRVTLDENLSFSLESHLISFEIKNNSIEDSYSIATTVRFLNHLEEAVGNAGIAVAYKSERRQITNPPIEISRIMSTTAQWSGDNLEVIVTYTRELTSVASNEATNLFSLEFDSNTVNPYIIEREGSHSLKLLFQNYAVTQGGRHNLIYDQGNLEIAIKDIDNNNVRSPEEVSVNVPPKHLASGNSILDFSIAGQIGDAYISEQHSYVIVKVPESLHLGLALVTFELSPGATAYVDVNGTLQQQKSGIQVSHFSSADNNNEVTSVTYVVKAQDGSNGRKWQIILIEEGNPSKGGDGIVFYVDQAGTLLPMPFRNVINTVEEDEDWVKLIISSQVGRQSHPNEFSFTAPEGIIIESGVELVTTHNHPIIRLTAVNGDIVLEEGVILLSQYPNNNVNEEIIIKAGKNVDIRNASLTARRYIEIRAGQNIFAQNADLKILTNSTQSNLILCLSPPTGTSIGSIFVNNLYLEVPANNVKPKSIPYNALVGTLRSHSHTFDSNFNSCN